MQISGITQFNDQAGIMSKNLDGEIYNMANFVHIPNIVSKFSVGYWKHAADKKN